MSRKEEYDFKSDFNALSKDGALPLQLPRYQSESISF